MRDCTPTINHLCFLCILRLSNTCVSAGLPTVDKRNPAPPKNPWIYDSLVNTTQTMVPRGFKVVQDFVHPRYVDTYSCRELGAFPMAGWCKSRPTRGPSLWMGGAAAFALSFATRSSAIEPGRSFSSVSFFLSFHLLKNMFIDFPLLVLKGIYHYWLYFIFSRGLKQMEMRALLLAWFFPWSVVGEGSHFGFESEIPFLGPSERGALRMKPSPSTTFGPADMK